MLFSYNWLQSFFKGKLPKPEKLAEFLTMHSFEVENLKKVKGDWIFDIAVLPNRAPDCFSHLGIAREISVLTGLTLSSLLSEIKEDKDIKAKDFVLVEVKDKIACPRYTARVITDIKVAPSPKWLKDRLKSCGLRPINNIVDIVNYVMLETGQPLHAFDFEKISGVQNQKSKLKTKNIVIRKTKKGEEIVTLDEEKYDLDENILIIADIEQPLAIAGIKGGKKAEIDEKTKIVVLESANFYPQVIRKGSRIINLRTDASLRFEHGIDPNLTEIAINRAASLIQEITGGKVTKGLIDFYSKKVLPKKIKLDLDYVEGLLGVKIPKKEIKNILKRLGFKIEEVSSQQLLVEILTFRLDISIPEDLIEEVGRIYGYEKIPKVFPRAALVPSAKNSELFWERKIKNILKETGFSEVYNYSFIGQKDISLYQFARSKEVIEIENPISSFNRYLRPSLIPNLLKNTKENLKWFDEIKIFELGKIFYKKEKKMLSGVLAKKESKDEEFFELKGIIDFLLNKLGISNVYYDQYKQTPEASSIKIWHSAKCAEIKIDGEEIGFLGEIHPTILEKTGIKEKVFVFDIDFEKLAKLSSEEQEYQPVSIHPSAIRDLAVLVPGGTKVEEVLNKIEVTGGELVRDVDLFDIYSGEEIPEGKENFAFHIIYQAEDRTLSSKEIDKIYQKIIKVLEENPEWEVRK